MYTAFILIYFDQRIIQKMSFGVNYINKYITSGATTSRRAFLRVFTKTVPTSAVFILLSLIELILLGRFVGRSVYAFLRNI